MINIPLRTRAMNVSANGSSSSSKSSWLRPATGRPALRGVRPVPAARTTRRATRPA
jgi:hypothetical protein